MRKRVKGWSGLGNIAKGARAGMENMPAELFDGLHDKDAIASEIDAFVEAVLGSNDREL